MATYVINCMDTNYIPNFSRLVAAASGLNCKRKCWSTNPKELISDPPLIELPYLEFDGVMLTQNVSIARFLAKEGKIAGRNNLEQAQADAIVDTVIDGYNEFTSKVLYLPESQQAEAQSKYYSETVQKHLMNIEKLIDMYGSNGYSVGNGFTWADLVIYEFTNLALSKVSSILDDFKGIKDVRRVSRYYVVYKICVK